MTEARLWRRGQFYWFYHESVETPPGQKMRTTKVDFVESGWPGFSMYGAIVHAPDAVNLRGWGIRMKRGVTTDSSDDAVLQLVPILPEFLLHAAGFGALLWLLAGGSSALRRLARHKSGHCPKCSYDLRGDITAGCPECGWGRTQ